MMRRPFLRSLVLCGTSFASALAMAATVVDNRLLADEDDGANWASYGRTFSENHYSPLKQIHDGNVSQLKLAWYYDLPPAANSFTAPLAVDGILYFAPGYSVVHAVDAP
jgi:quinohemoprotein ethanol dehydrogenase